MTALAWVWLAPTIIGVTAAIYFVALALREDGKLPEWAANLFDRLP